MEMTIAMALPNCAITSKVLWGRHVRSEPGISCAFDQDFWVVRTTHPCVGNDFRKMAWSINSSIDGNRLDSSATNGNNDGTILIRVIQALQSKLGVRILELRKDLPIKLLFFLAGFYCATAFSTVIGQTGDWDILSAALAVVVVEGIGALMYRASLSFLSSIRRLITMFNYWKAGLTLGLFLDSFKYEVDNIMGLIINPFNFEIDIFSLLL